MNWYKKALAVNPVNKINPKNISNPQIDKKEKDIWNQVKPRLRSTMSPWTDLLKNPKTDNAMALMFKQLREQRSTAPSLDPTLKMFRDLYKKQIEAPEDRQEQITENKMNAQEANQQMTNPTKTAK